MSEIDKKKAVNKIDSPFYYFKKQLFNNHFLCDSAF